MSKRWFGADPSFRIIIAPELENVVAFIEMIPGCTKGAQVAGEVVIFARIEVCYAVLYFQGDVVQLNDST